MPRIAVERPEHRADVLQLQRGVFGSAYEADLVERLDRDGLVVLSLAALEHHQVVGHILFSALAVEMDGRAVAAVSLAPMAVRPDRQRRGIGARLVTEGLARLPVLGQAAVIVLGHPDYYPRFGFSAALARRLAAPFRGDAFMALELAPNSLAGRSGTVRHPAAFGLDRDDPSGRTA